jgi:ribosomal protein S18 acetylase RimI-like enzyme
MIRAVPPTMGMEIRTFTRADTDAVIDLWRATGLVHPANDPHRDIDRKVADSTWGFLVLTENDEIIGSVMVGYDGHRGWINYLACHPDHQRKGVATSLMTRARELLLDRGCPKINLQVRSGNDNALRFYESIGYTDDSVASLGLRLIPHE